MECVAWPPHTPFGVYETFQSFLSLGAAYIETADGKLFAVYDAHVCFLSILFGYCKEWRALGNNFYESVPVCCSAAYGLQLEVVDIHLGIGHWRCVKHVVDCNPKLVEGVALDEDIKEKISMVKMDIEGSEMKALAGMKEHIKNDTPILLISVYHNNTDLVEIPKYIRSLNGNYDYYLRYYGGCVYATEIVLFALPKVKKVLVKNLI